MEARLIMAITKPQIKIHNAETGEIITRDMTAEEITQREADQAAAVTQAAAEAAKAAEKEALLDRLGITADEAKLLLS
jgi:hypothetical protein